MAKAIIGIGAGRVRTGQEIISAAVNQRYVEAIQKAGGIPLVIPVGITSSQFTALFSKLDGLLLTGGDDIDPLRYGSEMHPSVGGVDVLRDEMEIDLVKMLLQEKKPFLGICRGFEIINVALGGTLYTHIAEQLPNALHHPCYPDLPRDLFAHTVRIEDRSRLAQILGRTQVEVNSLHHQGIKTLAPGLTACAYAPDGLLEGFEIVDQPFALGVQWHPEELVHIPHMLALFEALVQAAS
jgi:putative glutamine amidotransferase